MLYIKNVSFFSGMKVHSAGVYLHMCYVFFYYSYFLQIVEKPLKWNCISYASSSAN